MSGSHNTIEGGLVTAGSVAGIALHTGATGTVVANNLVDSGTGVGILDDGASGTAITNNDVSGKCASGIKVGDASFGVSMENNVVNANGVAGTNCATPADVVDIGVYDGAVGADHRRLQRRVPGRHAEQLRLGRRP
ncbi:MAG: hypothetical protein V7603_4496 [Micromonosporaceae bacterium]